MTVFRADLPNDRVSIYTGSRTPAVESNPLGHMDRVIFHSDLPYLSAVQKVTGEKLISSPSVTDWAYYSTVNLFAHGLSYTPMVLPLMHNIYDYNGAFWPTVPGNLGVPNWRSSPRNFFNPPAAQANGQVGLTTIYANNTHVVAKTFFNAEAGSIITYNLKFTVYVTNVALEGEVNPPTSSGLIRVTPDEVTIAGKFSSNAIHFSESGPGDKVYFPMGATLANEDLGFRAMAVTFDGAKFISSPYGTKGDIFRSGVVSDASGITTTAITARVSG